ncbi:MAG: FAD-dependent monooxygenase [Planctomycetes bacterium]|nr:FAD-dependent monooxygenase [Planctomycetota bacterium]
MKIACIGGGPGGLYFSILMKKAFPAAEIDVYERNKPDDTFGWGVVFSDETLGGFEVADPESYAAIRENFKHWGHMETYYRGECVVSTGHGFCGLSRKRLLQIMHARCTELGVRLHFETDVTDLAPFAQHDLVLACDGVNSFIREKYAAHFKPHIDWRKCKFAWLGTDKPLEAFTFVFKESEHGLFQVHAYPFEDGLSTWIVECREETWKRAGLDQASEADTVRFCEELFRDELGGHKLLTNRSIWRTFPTITNEVWHHGNTVLIGDALHTAHFSIGSGTKLAMEDAIGLVEAFKTHGTGDVAKAAAAYQAAREVDGLKLQKTAYTSLKWFENSARYMGQTPVTFTFNLMTRSKRITYDNLAKRDPELVRRADEEVFAAAGGTRRPDGSAPPPMFTPFTVGGLELANRAVVSPMCQYQAKDGVPGDWHLAHYGARGLGGAALLICEATAVAPEGRITPGCTGIWNEEQATAWRRVTDFVHGYGTSKIGLQIGHAGRKASCDLPWKGGAPLAAGAGAWPTLGPSPLPFDEGWHVPAEVDRADMDRLKEDFVAAAQRAHSAGFDLLELHMAHGYLLSSFLSPLPNQRKDEYGGSLENRARFPLEVLRAVRETWRGPLSVRISASDWLGADGFRPKDAVAFARWAQEAGADVIDVSSGGNTPKSRIDYGRMYQLPFAEKIKFEVGVPVLTVGAVQGADHVNTIVAAGRADLCAMARPHLADPYLTLHAAERYGVYDVRWPNSYLAVAPRPPR